MCLTLTYIDFDLNGQLSLLFFTPRPVGLESVFSSPPCAATATTTAPANMAQQIEFIQTFNSFRRFFLLKVKVIGHTPMYTGGLKKIVHSIT